MKKVKETESLNELSYAMQNDDKDYSLKLFKAFIKIYNNNKN